MTPHIWGLSRKGLIGVGQEETLENGGAGATLTVFKTAPNSGIPLWSTCCRPGALCILNSPVIWQAVVEAEAWALTWRGQILPALLG